MRAPVKPRITRRILVFVGIGLTALILYLYYFIGTTNVAAKIEETNPLLYGSAFIAFLASVTFYAIAWQGMLRNLRIRIGIRQALLYAWAGMFFDAVIPDPGWSGDLSKAYMLSKASGRDAGEIYAKAGARGLNDALALAQTEGELRQAARLAAKEGVKTRAVLALLGRSALIGASLAGTAVFWSLALLGQLLVLAAMTQRLGWRVGESLFRRRRKGAQATVAA